MKSRPVIALALSSLFALALLVSCGDKEGGKDVKFTISFEQKAEVHETTVSATTTQAFVYIFSNGDWTLEAHDDEDVGLSMTSAKLGAAKTLKLSGSGDSGPIVLNFPKNTDDGQRSVEFEGSCAGVKKTVTITQRGAHEDTVVIPSDQVTPINGGSGSTDASGNTVYIDGVSGGRATSAPYRWLELPATDNRDALHFVWHNFYKSGEYYRNYSLYWDYDNLVALWVAYPLCKWHFNTTDTGRTNLWALDPLVDDSKEPNLTKGFKEGNSGWFARGHQLPSADRYVGNSNSQTFYGTNMTPQDNTFNGGLWGNLENKVRSWAEKCDTVYVVTGCTVAGSSKYALDNATPQKRVTVPTGYYKAVIAYSKSSTFAGASTGGYMGCAFYYDHFGSYSSSVTKSMGMSIDALEAKIGIDLFVNLPSVVGSAVADQIEAANPQNVSWWW